MNDGSNFGILVESGCIKKNNNKNMILKNWINKNADRDWRIRQYTKCERKERRERERDDGETLCFYLNWKGLLT